MTVTTEHDNYTAPGCQELHREDQEVNTRHAEILRQAERSRQRNNNLVEDMSGVPTHHDVIAESNEEALRWDAQDLARPHQQPAYAMPSTPGVPVARQSTIFSGVAEEGSIVLVSLHSTGGDHGWIRISRRARRR